MSRGYIAKSKRSDWLTPEEVLLPVFHVFRGPPDLDPCGNKRSIVRARRQYLLPKQDGLNLAWAGKVFVNPPFDDVATWLRKAVVEASSYSSPDEIIFLMPSRTDTKAWHECATTADAICFWKGRMKFVGAAASAPFPTVLLYWGSRLNEFGKVFRLYGHVVRP